MYVPDILILGAEAEVKHYGCEEKDREHILHHGRRLRDTAVATEAILHWIVSIIHQKDITAHLEREPTQ